VYYESNYPAKCYVIVGDKIKERRHFVILKIFNELIIYSVFYSMIALNFSHF